MLAMHQRAIRCKKHSFMGKPSVDRATLLLLHASTLPLFEIKSEGSGSDASRAYRSRERQDSACDRTIHRMLMNCADDGAAAAAAATRVFQRVMRATSRIKSPPSLAPLLSRRNRSSDRRPVGSNIFSRNTRCSSRC